MYFTGCAVRTEVLRWSAQLSVLQSVFKPENKMFSAELHEILLCPSACRPRIRSSCLLEFGVPQKVLLDILK
jgi:hypothetical protein